MASAVQFGGSSAQATQARQNATFGSLFGVDQNLLNYPVLAHDGSTPNGHAQNGGHDAQAQHTTVLQMLSSFHHMSSDERDGAVAAMEHAGYLSPLTPDSKGKVKPHKVQEVDSAWRSVVLDAARSGQTITDLLDQRAAESADAAGSGAAVTQTSKATNPLDVHALGNQAGQAGLGMDLTADQQQHLLSDFQSKESSYLLSNATTSEPGAAGWADWAQTQVREMDPTRFDARKVVSNLSLIAKALAS